MFLFNLLIFASGFERATDLIYCQQDLSVLLRDLIGSPPYEVATDLIYCEQDLSVFNRTP